ncbi:MAG: hypothetical protein ACI81R_002602 [Bradymonadia bacterium]|jgi:hypothetical protein
MRIARFGVLAALVGLVGCSSDDGAPAEGGSVNVDEAFFVATLPEEVAASQTLAFAGSQQGRAAGVVPRDWGRVGGLQGAPFLIATSVNQNQSGQETQITTTDVNGDGLNEEVVSVLVTADATYLAWEGATISAAGDDLVEAVLCHMLWEDSTGRYYARGGCASDAGMACRLDGIPTCLYSTVQSNADCTITDGLAVCEEPVSVIIPDAVTDTGGDAGTSDTTTGDDAGSDSGGGPVTFGECAPACLAENETDECCTDCSCGGSFVCIPVCPDGTEWDCESSCCFNFDVLECADL